MTRSSEYAIAAADLHEWNALALQCGDATVFHLLPWLLAISAANRLQMTLLTAWREGQCVAVWPLLELRMAMLRVIGSPLPGWSTPYLGPLFRPDLPGSEINAVLREFLRHRAFRHYSYFACKVIDHNRSMDLSDFGFARVMKYDTYRLDLNRNEDELWNGMRRECRNHVRKAQKSSVSIRFVADERFTDDYWSMSVETFAKAGVLPTHNRDLVAQIVEKVIPAGHALAVSAFHGDTRIAAALLMCDSSTMYYWGGASRLEHRHFSPHNLLQWEAIREAKRRGMQTYDFVSTTGGPGKFKQSFGPKCVTISTHWERSPSRLFLALKNRYRRYLELRRQLPARVVGDLGSMDEFKPVIPPACV